MPKTKHLGSSADFDKICQLQKQAMRQAILEDLIDFDDTSCLIQQAEEAAEEWEAKQWEELERC